MAKKAYIGEENFPRKDLPSGYTQVEYIESSGAQYIDTGFKPNQDTRVVADIQMVAENTLAANDIFGARTSASSKVFAVQWNTANNQFQHFYNNGYDNLDFGNFGIRQVCEMNKNVFSLNGVTHTRTYASFQCDYSLFIFAVNNAGSAQFYSNMRLYSCQIFNNVTLIRNFVPCINPSGEAGLYDMANGVFYANDGTGSFTTGAAYQRGVAREVDSIYLGVAGVTRKVKKSYLGDENGISREWFVSESPIGNLPIGASVFMNVNGVRTEFLVVQQGKPSGYWYDADDSYSYDSSCNGTWLLMKDVYPVEMKYYEGSTYLFSYKNSTIHSYLTNTFFYLLDSNIQAIVKQVKLPVWHGNTIETKVFLPSAYELGMYCFEDDEGNPEIPADGSKLDYFIADSYYNTDPAAYEKRKCYNNGNPTSYPTRTTRIYDSVEDDFTYLEYWRVSTGGGIHYQYANYDTPPMEMPRPAMILPSDTIVDGDSNVIT